MKLIVIGAVAAGTSAAAKARRKSATDEIIVYEKDTDISYSGCGMPYFIGGFVPDGSLLTPRNSRYFKDKYNIDVKTGHEVISIDATKKTLKVRDLSTGKEFIDRYDKLILALGAYSSIPPIKGVNLSHVFKLRNIRDMYQINDFISSYKPKNIVIIGTGFIGLELAENLHHLEMNVTMVEIMNQVSPSLDEDMSIYVEKHLIKNGVTVKKNTNIVEITTNKIIIDNDKSLEADMVIVSTGVRSNTKLAKEIGIKLGSFGGIKANNKMETNIKDIYACGDCIEQTHIISGKSVYRPLAQLQIKPVELLGIMQLVAI